jgi:hypothetical protein
MKNVHVLPIDKPSRLVKNGKGLLLVEIPKSYTFFGNNVSANICITSDDEIKEGEYGLSKLNEIIKFHSGYDYKYYTKIILTTDQDLIKDGVQAIDDEFLEWFVNNPSCDEVEVEAKWFTYMEYKIIIPKEEPKQETLEEASKIYQKNFGVRPNQFADDDFIAGAKSDAAKNYWFNKFKKK